MKTDIVIPYLHSPRNNGLELRFCLRSIEKYLKDYNDIWIIGDKPSWLKNCKHISVKDSPYPRLKENNIYRKIIAACENPEVSENFLFMNDDHFLLKPHIAPTFNYYHRGELYASMVKNKGSYRATLNHSKKVLEERGLPPLDYDCHAPIIYNKKNFIKAFEGLVWKDWGYAIKSIYCGINKIEGMYMTDCKISSNIPRDIKLKAQNREWFSTGNINPNMEIFLSGLYPKKSIYEL